MLFKDAYTSENSLKYYVHFETNQMYHTRILELQEMGFTVNAIVCDGRKGLLGSYEEIELQMCQFHQAAIIRRHSAKNPKLEISKGLENLVCLMSKTNKESFIGALND